MFLKVCPGGIGICLADVHLVDAFSFRNKIFNVLCLMFVRLSTHYSNWCSRKLSTGETGFSIYLTRMSTLQDSIPFVRDFIPRATNRDVDINFSKDVHWRHKVVDTLFISGT